MCGIYGVQKKGRVLDELLNGLVLLSHRGQEAAGILTIDARADAHHLHRGFGQASSLMSTDLTRVEGDLGIGHLRYGTTSDGSLDNAQPYWVDAGIGLVHNGQVENMARLRSSIEAAGNTVLTESDAELLLKIFSQRYVVRQESIAEQAFAAAQAVLAQAKGGYACIYAIKDLGLLALRDPHGIRPIVMGKTENAVAFSSESVALERMGYTQIRDLVPGEVVLAGRDGHLESRTIVSGQKASCAFEYFYFADASSRLDGVSVNRVRYDMGKWLAREWARKMPHKTLDRVVPIPNTPRPTAEGFSKVSGVRYGDLIYKQQSAQRIYITPGDDARLKKAEQSFYFAGENDKNPFSGKSIMLIDDSIVRGTNMLAIVRKVRSLGAREVHIGIAFPPITHACPYGVDMRSGLIAPGKTLEDLRKYFAADSLTYATTEAVLEVVGRLGNANLCMSCVTGDYPTRD
jgi:amidophosphoribosyltransferase